jgi:teichuronic acid biosynthesis glycosyltransferase TuaG
MPRVSVIVPAYNAADFIAETLASVEAQTYPDWEIVVADDCSDDRTVEIAAGFGGAVKVVQAIANGGPAAARNLGIADSTGELLAFLDADDLWLPEYLEQQVSLFDASQAQSGDVGLVACDARILGPNGLLAGTYADYMGAPALTLRRLIRSNTIFVSTLSPRAVVDEAGGFAAEIFGAEDHDLWLRILELGYRLVANARPLAIYRRSAGSVSADPASLARASQRVYRRALERGNLPRRERLIARRELRLQRAAERVADTRGSSLLRAVPCLALVALEHPRRWPSYLRMLLRREIALSPFADSD